MLPFLPLVVGLGVREVVAGKVAAPVLIKWPNDVLAGERKIAGILLESLSRAGSIRAVVIGVGLNVRTRRFPHELVDAATSLLLLGAADLSLEPLLADLLAAFERRFHELASVGFEPQWRELNRVDALRGTKIRVDERVGIASGIDKNGALTLLVDGQKQPVWVGHVVPVTASEC
jgi:BirA family biotin operon repressor/biotin-[acetyl-CoA-carboxylase] ligase